MASSRYASYIEEEDWDLGTLQVVNAHLEQLVTMVRKLLTASDALRLVLQQTSFVLVH
jgi:hypothetical protein